MKNAIIFVVGALCGSIGTWIATKSVYEKKANDEIESVKEVYANHFTANAKSEEETVNQDVTPDTSEADIMEQIIRVNGYTSTNAPEEEQKVSVETPYVIKPEEYGEFENYERISLTYYSDGVITDENDEIVDDVDDILGPNVAGHFGEYEDDAVHIRNDVTKCDYEVLYDLRPYSAMRSKAHPH